MAERDTFQVVHGEIQFEHNLISNRMNWYVTSQAFLMGAFAVAEDQGNRLEWLARSFLPPLALALSVSIWVGIIAALWSMCRLRRCERELLKPKSAKATGSEAQPAGAGSGAQSAEKGYSADPWASFAEIWSDSWQVIFHYCGMAAPAVIPVLFISAWIIIWAKFA